MTEELDATIADEAATRALGEALAPGVAPGRVLFLSGELGTGKTTLARGLIRALGHRGHVKSPTYALLELYRLSRLDLYHFDFYRFKDRSEWTNSGFRDCFNPATACLVEWPERVGDLLGPPDLWIRLSLAQVGRTARLTACSPAGRDWLDDFSKRLPSA